MRQILKPFFVLSLFWFCIIRVLSQDQNCDILSDSIRFADYVYNKIHYPLIDYINNTEGIGVYKFDIDTITGIKEIKTIKSSGSFSLDREGKRLIWELPYKVNEYAKHEITINFKLADNIIYNTSDVLDNLPEFPGGNDKIAQFITKNFNWPPEGADMGIQGRVICGFVIEKDGTINIVEVLTSLDQFFDAEALRVIKRMPNWKPGKINGKHVRVYFIVPIPIKLQAS